MGIIVQKYGGTSVGTIDKIREVAKSVISKAKCGDKMVIVVSAMGDTTDHLISLAKKINENPDKRELDVLMSTGEIVSSSLLAMTIKTMGYDAISYTAYQVGIKTVGQHGKSLIDDIETEKITKQLDKNKIVVIAGFQGINDEGDITTLGRGGSDTSAVALAVALKGTCEIYTDIDGIYSVDPRNYPNAKKIDEIDYEEMLELSSLGAQIMHSRSVELGQKYNIPIYVGLSNSNIKGTYIKEVKNMNMENKPITGIATSDDDIAITIRNADNDICILSKIFEEIAGKKINIDMISQTSPINSKVNISFTIPKDDLSDCTGILSQFAPMKNISIDEDITKFSVVGIGMKTTSGVASTIFRLFADNNIEVKMITTSEIRITCAIKQADKLKAIKLVAEKFNL